MADPQTAFSRVKWFLLGYEVVEADDFLDRVRGTLGQQARVGDRVSAKEARTRRFTRRYGGYNMDRVDRWLDQLAEDLSRGPGD